MQPTSLKNLVEKYGYGIRVKSVNSIYSIFPFTIISESDESHYLVSLDDGR